jgi:fructose-1-phosphate kinase PfkB-like protein
MDRTDLDAAQAALLPLVQAGDLVVLSGSVPPGWRLALKDLARALAMRAARWWPTRPARRWPKSLRRGWA